MGLQTGYSNSVSTDDATPVRGPFLCLVAAAGEGESEGKAKDGAPRTYPRPPWPAAWLPATTWGAFGEAATTAGPIRGAVVVDVQGGHVPPRQVRARGTTRLVQRAGLAYVSNLAVSPAARRAHPGPAGAQSVWQCVSFDYLRPGASVCGPGYPEVQDRAWHQLEVQVEKLATGSDIRKY